MRITATQPLFAWATLEDSPSLETVRRCLEAIPDASLLQGLRQARGHGRDDYPVSVLWGVAVLTPLLRHPSYDGCLAELRRNPTLCRLLGVETEARLSSLCSFRTLYFTPESGPATEGFSCRGAVMNDEGNAARKIRKLRASRDLWKQRSAEKQQEIRQLRVTVRDLSSSRENWKTRVKELEQQLQAAHEAHAAVGPGSWIFFGGLMDNQAMPRTRRTPITLSSD